MGEMLCPIDNRKVEGLRDLTKVSIMIKERDFAGIWKVIEAMDMMDDYLSLTPDPHLKIEVNGEDEVAGSFEFGAQDGDIDGQFEQDKESLRLIFSFEGWDEGDEVHGFGTASI
jgi:hypothetical protein